MPELGENVITGSGLPVPTVTVVECAPVRPALSVITRLTTKTPADEYACEMILVPTQCESPGQLMIGVLSPKFHARLAIVVPCVVVDVDGVEHDVV